MTTNNGVEIERKFIVTDMPPLEFLQNPTFNQQGYLVLGDDGSEVRLRQAEVLKTGTVYHNITVKSKGGLIRGERETDLSVEQFDTLWPMTAGKRVLKTRYRTEHDGHTYEIDSYLGTLAGLMVLEVEFDSAEAATDFCPPHWAGADVSEVITFKNQRLALMNDFKFGGYILKDGRYIEVPKLEEVKK